MRRACVKEKKTIIYSVSSPTSTTTAVTVTFERLRLSVETDRCFCSASHRFPSLPNSSQLFPSLLYSSTRHTLQGEKNDNNNDDNNDKNDDFDNDGELERH